MDILNLSLRFRKAIDDAKRVGEFDTIADFKYFPLGSCGSASYLLAEFLLEHGIYTEYVEGVRKGQSHAWLALTTKEDIEHKRKTALCSSHSVLDDDIHFKDNSYSVFFAGIESMRLNISKHSAQNNKAELEGRTIIDITGDQFRSSIEFLKYNTPVYVGEMDQFHNLFEILSVHECPGLYGACLTEHEIYASIKRYLE